MDGFINRDGGRLEIFGGGGGNQLYRIWQNAANGSTGWSGWAGLGGALQPGSGISAYRYPDNSAYVDVIGGDGYAHTKIRSSSGTWDPAWY
jgi:hypothetical protein